MDECRSFVGSLGERGLAGGTLRGSVPVSALRSANRRKPGLRNHSREVRLASSGGKARLAAAESRGPIASWGIERIRFGRVIADSEVVHIG
jgi:hypothetical protein